MQEKVKTEDGFELDVRIQIPTENYKGTIIMCHGLMENKKGKNNQFIKLADKLYEKKYRVIQFDFRGHGKSTGIDLDVSLTSLYNDLLTIINHYIKENERYYLFGFSFGGFTVSEYLYKEKIKNINKVLLIGPPIDPLNSLFKNPNSFSNKYYKRYKENNEKYIIFDEVNWHVSKQFIEEVEKYDYKTAISYLPKSTLLLQGKYDDSVGNVYNKQYAKEYGFQYNEYEASHSLSQIFDQIIPIIVDYFEN